MLLVIQLIFSLRRNPLLSVYIHWFMNGWTKPTLVNIRHRSVMHSNIWQSLYSLCQIKKKTQKTMTIFIDDKDDLPTNLLSFTRLNRIRITIEITYWRNMLHICKEKKKMKTLLVLHYASFSKTKNSQHYLLVQIPQMVYRTSCCKQFVMIDWGVELQVFW